MILILTAVLQNSKFIINLEELGKFSIFSLVISTNLWLNKNISICIQLLVLEGRGLDKETIDIIVSKKLSGPEPIFSMKYFTKTILVFFKNY